MMYELSFPNQVHCSALSHLIESSYDRLSERGAIRQFKSGQQIYAMGDPTDHLYILLSGRVRTSVLSPEGQELVVGLHGPGEMFGEICFCAVKQRQEQAFATEETTAARLGIVELSELAASSPTAVVDLLAGVCHRTVTMQEQMIELAFVDVRTRLALLLLRLVSKGPIAADGSRSATENLTQEEMASRISTTREQVSILLTEFRNRGLVEYRRGSPVRVYPEKLQEYLDNMACV